MRSNRRVISTESEWTHGERRAVTTRRYTNGFLLALLSLLPGTLASGDAAPEAGWPGMPDPLQHSLVGLPFVPETLGDAVFRPASGRFPLEPLDRDPTEGLRHGFVQTSSGRFGFRVTDLALPSRVPLLAGRVYDAGLLASLPGVPFGYEPRMSRDLGPNWILQPTSVLLPTPTGFLLLTDQGGVVPYVLDPTSGTYLPSPNRPSEFGPMTPDGQGGYRVRMSSGRLRIYEHLAGDANYYLVREEDGAGNGITLSYRIGAPPETVVYLERIDSTDGHWIRFDRPVWGAPAPPSTPATRVVAMVDSIGRTVNLVYDAGGQLVGATEASGAAWTYSWDAAKHLTEITDPLGRRAFDVTTDGSSRATVVEQFTVRTEYIYEPGRTRVRNILGDTWIYEKDPRGMTRRLTDPEGGVTTIERDAGRGDVSRIVDGAGGVHLFEHDSGHRITRYQAPTVATGVPVWTFLWDSDGRLLRSLNPVGAASVLSYDAAGLLIAEGSDPDADGTAEAVTQYERDASTGDIVARSIPVTAGEVRRTEYAYGAHGELTLVRPPALDGGTIAPEIHLEWDAAGRLSTLRWPTGPGTWADWGYTWHATGTIASTIDPLGQQWVYVSDPVGAITEVHAPNGGISRYAWRANGKLERHEDAAGAVTQRDYDSAGRLWRIVDPGGGTWTYEWDGADRLVSKTDAENRTWHFRYDGAGRLTEQEHPGGPIVAFTWDAAGRLIRRDLPGGESEHYAWDPAGQLIEARQVVADGDSLVEDRWNWTWDGRGLPLTMLEELAEDGAPESVQWSWNLAGELTAWDLASEGTTAVARDEWGRVVEVSGAGTPASGVEYEPWTGWVVYRRHGAGPGLLEEHYTRDAAGRISGFVEVRDGGEVLHDAVMTRDALGRVIERVDNAGGVSRTTSYTWDLLGRLRSEEQVGDPATDYVETLSWSRFGQLVGRRRKSSLGAPTERYFQYDRIGRPVAVTGSSSPQLLMWEDAPVGRPAAVGAKRLDFGDALKTVEIEYDAAFQARRVFADEDGTLNERHRFRWAPGGHGLPSVSRAWGADGVLVAQTRFVQGLHEPSRGLPLEGARWRTSDLDLVAAADGGAWRNALPGRRFMDRDDGRAALRLAEGEARAAALRIGGLRTGAGIGLPEASDWSRALQGSDLPTAEAERVRSGLPQPVFFDPEWGLPGAAAPVLTPRPSHDPERCTTRQTIARTTAQCGLGHSLAVQEIRDPFIDVTPCYMADCHGGGGHGESTGGGPADFSHPQEPIRNSDTHPLGVTLSNGNFLLTVTDLKIPGHGLDLVLSRTFRSQSYVGSHDLWTLISHGDSPLGPERVTG